MTAFNHDAHGAIGTAYEASQGLPFDEPSESDLENVRHEAQQTCAGRLRNEPTFWAAAMQGMTLRPGSKHAANLLYADAMHALRTIAADQRQGRAQTVQGRAIGRYINELESLATQVASESAADYLQDGKAHKDAVRLAVNRVMEGCV